MAITKIFYNIACMLQDKRQEMQRRSELEHKMTEILENLKTRLLVE